MKKPVLEWMDDGDEFDWECMTDCFTDILTKFNPKGGWHAEVEGFGWRGISGHKDFRATTGAQFLQNILPHTECRFNIFKEKNAIKLQNYHHDSPVGNEWYTITKNNRQEA